MELLRFFTAGNVDDGKSTLIGRLLFDSKSISTDIIETLTQQSKAINSDAEIDLALLTDGLRAEREQGITIDVAYKYFTTEKRKFIIADTPGHIQYTRNMFTGASTADAALILIDARSGITEQTKRHSIISSLLGIEHTVVCINKMDLVGNNQTVFDNIVNEYSDFSKPLGLKNTTFIPVSALFGDNIVTPSESIQWYQGPSLLEFLENVTLQNNEVSSRFQVQYVIRPQTSELPDYRGFAGKILSGNYKKGDNVVVHPENITTSISKIEMNGKEVEEAVFPQSIILHLTDNVDVSRGSSIVPSAHVAELEKEFTAIICWMDNVSLQPGQKLLLQQNSFTTKAVVKEIVNKIDIHTFGEIAPEETIGLNDIYKVSIKTAIPVSFDLYKENKANGAFILVNENSNQTIAAGVIVKE